MLLLCFSSLWLGSDFCSTELRDWLGRTCPCWTLFSCSYFYSMHGLVWSDIVVDLIDAHLLRQCDNFTCACSSGFFLRNYHTLHRIPRFPSPFPFPSAIPFLFPLHPSLPSISLYLFFFSFTPHLFLSLHFLFPFPSPNDDVDGRASVTKDKEAQSNSHLFQAIMHHSYMTKKQMHSVIVGRIKR